MLFNRKDEDDEYNRYMQEREDEKKGESSEFSSDSGYVKDEINCNKIARMFKPHIMQDERVLWAQAGKERGDCLTSLVVRGFAVLWLTITIAALAGELAEGFSLLKLTNTIPFFAIGIFLLLVMRKSTTYYAITDKRVISLCKNKVYYDRLGSISNVTYAPAKNNKGNVGYTVMGSPFYRSMNSTGISTAAVLGTPSGIWQVPDAKQAYDILCSLTNPTMRR